MSFFSTQQIIRYILDFCWFPVKSHQISLFFAKGPLARVPAPGAMTMIRLREVERCLKDLGITRWAQENLEVGAPYLHL